MQLSHIAHLFMGISPYGRAPLGKGRYEIGMINIKDMEEGTLNISNLQKIKVSNLEQIGRCRISTHDILLTIRGTLFKTAIIPQELDGCLITSNLVAIHLYPDAPLLPIVLQAFLDSPGGRHAVLTRSRSTTNDILLSIKDLGELEIPIPSQEKQTKLAALLMTHRHYRLAAQGALKSREKIVQTIVSEYFGRVA